MHIGKLGWKSMNEQRVVYLFYNIKSTNNVDFKKGLFTIISYYILYNTTRTILNTGHNWLNTLIIVQDRGLVFIFEGNSIEILGKRIKRFIASTGVAALT